MKRRRANEFVKPRTYMKRQVSFGQRSKNPSQGDPCTRRKKVPVTKDGKVVETNGYIKYKTIVVKCRYNDACENGELGKFCPQTEWRKKNKSKADILTDQLEEEMDAT